MRVVPLLLVAGVLSPALAAAQPAPPPVSRLDLTVSTGWFAADRNASSDCCNSGWSAGLFKGVAAGFYWTDHLKTEIGFAAPGSTEGYGFSSRVLPNGLTSYTSEDHHIDGTKVSIAQIYQFGRNSTFHPFIVGGADIDREHDTIERFTSSSSSSHTTDTRIETSIRARAFAGTGFKAYFSDRAFFRGEARFAGGRQHGGQMTWTAGVGVDLGGGSGTKTTVAEAAPHSTPRSQEPLDVWRNYTSGLKTGAVVDVKAAGSDSFIAELVAADADGILVKPVTRMPEPIRHVPFDRLETLALHDGPRPGARVGATLAGVGTGAGVLLTILFATINHFGG
jgi:outer membrane protein with beta-barrel domain